jgi:RimJ/RimL family protein N-acetyltransferase
MIRILQRARSLGIPVRLQCMRVNPRALAFYDRLGFRVIGEDETHLLLQGE